jgi:uncharacterized protein
MEKNMTRRDIWFDIITPAQAHFLNSLIQGLDEYNIYLSARKKAETLDLLNHYGLKYKIIGKDYENEYLKYLGILSRTINLFLITPKFDVSVCFQNGMCSLTSKLRMRKNIIFDDNDYRLSKKTISLDLFIKLQSMSNYYIVPEACYENFKKIIPNEKLLSFNGYKEDVYIAIYKQNKDFLKEIPFEKYVVLRPEALDAVYVKTVSIIPQLIKALTKEQINIIFIPRENKDYFAKKYNDSNVFVPHQGLNGLDLCFFSEAVLTGSGTLAREAACIGKTAISFFPSDVLLSVDKKMVDERKIFHSRNVEEIVNYVLSNKNKNQKTSFEHCEKVRDEVLGIVKNIASSLGRI